VKLEFPAGALRPIGSEQMARARAEAARSPRRRAIVRFHEHHEAVQRMLNAVEPDSYVRPHCHLNPDKTEAFVVLSGRAVMVRWSEDGELLDQLAISADGPLRGVEIPPGVWHSFVSLEPGTVLYETLEGPFFPGTHKRYAAWAPDEGSEAGRRFHEALRARLGA